MEGFARTQHKVYKYTHVLEKSSSSEPQEISDIPPGKADPEGVGQ